MAYLPRVDVGGYVYHVLNRGNGGMRLFKDDGDYVAFEGVLEEALERQPAVKLLSYCVMPNHWHLALETTKDGVLSPFVTWMTITHSKRWHGYRQTTGGGHVYQGRYRSYLVETENYLVTLCRYIERNPVRAGLVEDAQDWRWSSLWRWSQGNSKDKTMLSPWPVPGQRRPAGWVNLVNQPLTEAEREAIQASNVRGRPLGNGAWQREMAGQFGLEQSLRNRGRPPKKA